MVDALLFIVNRCFVFMCALLQLQQCNMNKYITSIMISSLALMSFGSALPALAAPPAWDTTGAYVVNMNYLGTDYPHDVVLTQDGLGNLTGSGGSPAGANVYTWTITSGTVDGSTVDFYANYTATPDAVVPQTTLHIVATIALNGTMSGTWSDNYQGGARSGTLATVSGAASPLATLSAEDFGVVDYNTGNGQLAGYTAGFGLTDGTFAGATSVVVRLYAGATLLQTNTAILPKFNADITGTQFSSPFDVSGTFNYAADGYWTNVRQAQYGQSVPATRVVATVTLASGQIVTAENTTLVGDPTTIYPDVTPPTPTDKNQCKNGGWMTFTNPTFRNQGACVSYVMRNEHASFRHEIRERISSRFGSRFDH